MHTPLNCSLDILLVEDNPADIVLLEEILEDTGINCNVHIVQDGEEAISFLQQEGNFTDAPPPDIILLDLNIPKKNGHAVLREIKEDEQFKHIPVIVLTTSQSDDDILKSYRLHANCYLVKPSSTDEFVALVKLLEMFWFNKVKLPGRSKYCLM